MKRKIKAQIWRILIMAICLVLMGQIGHYKAASDPDKIPAPSSPNQDTSTLIQSQPQKETEKITEHAEAIPSRNPLRAKPGKDKFCVQVSIAEQKVFVLKNGKPIKTITCSTGISGKETPLGSYKINKYYGLNFYNNKYLQGANYWVGFQNAVYLFHSVPVDKQGNIIEAEADKLGIPASHGCIRMSMYDAFWFYETVPEGTEVMIQ